MRRNSTYCTLVAIVAALVIVGRQLPAAAAEAASTGDLFSNLLGGLLGTPTAQGAIAMLLVQGLKAAPVPFQGRTLAGVVAALTVVSVLVNLALAVLTGTVHQVDAGVVIGQILPALQVLFSAAGIYSLGKFALALPSPRR